MDLTSLHELKELLNAHDLWAKKHLSQNFLINKWILHAIINAADIQPNDKIIEVGPGPGVLTAELAKQCNTLTVVETDRSIIPVLKEYLKTLEEETKTGKKILIINKDILKWQPPPKTYKKRKYKVVANLPYHITSPVLRHFLQRTNPPSCMVLMVQKEVAEKCCAKAGAHSILSLSVQLFGSVKIVQKVPCNAFYPAPRIDSAIIKVEVHHEPLLKNQNEIKQFFQLIHLAFHQKRKQLLPTLSKGLKKEKSLLIEDLEACDIEGKSRPEEIPLEKWIKLTRQIK